MDRLVQAMAHVAHDDLSAFCSFVLGHPPARHHIPWLKAVIDPEVRRLLIIAPPASAKTTIMAIAAMAWHIGHNPLSTNFIGSVSTIQAVDRARAVAQMIEGDPRYRAVFPHIKPDVDWWRAGDYVVYNDDGFTLPEWRAHRMRQGQPKDATLYAAGVEGQGVIGRRFTGLVVLDDPNDEENSRTKLQRDRLWDWFRMVLLTRLDGPHAKVITIMTRWHREDLAGRILETDEWTVIHTPAIRHGRSYWPDRFPIEELRRIKREVGSSLFRASYQGDPRGLTGEVFKREWLRAGYPDDFDRRALKRVVVTADLAISQSETAAYTSVVVAGADRSGRLIVLDLRRGRWTFREQIEQLKDACAWALRECGRLDDVVLEKNQYQNAATQELLRETALPVRSVHHHRDKVARARPLAALAEAGMFFLGDGPWVGELFDEMLEFPRSAHVDQIDALAMAHEATRVARTMEVRQGNPFYR